MFYSPGPLARRGRAGPGQGYINHGLVGDQETEREGRAGSRARAQSQLSMAGGRASRQSRAGGGRQGGPGALTYRHDAPILNDKYFPKDNYGSLANIVDMEETEAGFKYPHLQVGSLSLSSEHVYCLPSMSS